MSATEFHRGAVRRTGGCSATRSVLLLGEDNPQSSDPEHSLYPSPPGCAGDRLRRLIAGLDHANYMGLWRTNLCSPTLDSKSAIHRGWELLGADVPWTKIVCLGVKVAKVMGWASRLVLFESSRIELNERVFELLYLPHPSGRCFVWNDPESVPLAVNALTNMEPRIPWGVTL